MIVTLGNHVDDGLMLWQLENSKRYSGSRIKVQIISYSSKDPFVTTATIRDALLDLFAVMNRKQQVLWLDLGSHCLENQHFWKVLEKCCCSRTRILHHVTTCRFSDSVLHLAIPNCRSLQLMIRVSESEVVLSELCLALRGSTSLERLVVYSYKNYVPLLQAVGHLSSLSRLILHCHKPGTPMVRELASILSAPDCSLQELELSCLSSATSANATAPTRHSIDEEVFPVLELVPSLARNNSLQRLGFHNASLTTRDADELLRCIAIHNPKLLVLDLFGNQINSWIFPLFGSVHRTVTSNLQEIILSQNPCSMISTLEEGHVAKATIDYWCDIVQKQTNIFRLRGLGHSSPKLQYLLDWNRSQARRLLLNPQLVSNVPIEVWPHWFYRLSRVLTTSSPAKEEQQNERLASVAFTALKESQIYMHAGNSRSDKRNDIAAVTLQEADDTGFHPSNQSRQTTYKL